MSSWPFLLPDYAEDSNIYFVAEVLIPKILRNRAVITHSTDSVILARSGCQPTLSAHRGDAPQDGLTFRLKGH
ncbi:hypothetical protein STENM327S_03233 [Streptomyces tendae]